MNDETILTRIRRQLAGQVPPPVPQPWRGRPPYPDPVGQLALQLERNGAEARIASDAEALAAHITEILQELAPASAVVNPDPEIADLSLPTRFPHIGWTVAGETTREELRARCASADVGISGGTAALAETGSVAVESGPNRSRLVTLLPPVCILVVRAATILPDIFAWTASRGGTPPANVVLISGPSKSADIEQTLAVGVHGPRRLIVIIRER